MCRISSRSGGAHHPSCGRSGNPRSDPQRHGQGQSSQEQSVDVHGKQVRPRIVATRRQLAGKLPDGTRMVLMSDGVVEARSKIGELYGFDRLGPLTLQTARDIAATAQAFGQEDDITVLTLACTT